MKGPLSAMEGRVYQPGSMKPQCSFQRDLHEPSDIWEAYCGVTNPELVRFHRNHTCTRPHTCTTCWFTVSMVSRQINQPQFVSRPPRHVVVSKEAKGTLFLMRVSYFKTRSYTKRGCDLPLPRSNLPSPFPGRGGDKPKLALKPLKLCLGLWAPWLPSFLSRPRHPFRRIFGVQWLTKREVILVAALLELVPCVLMPTVRPGLFSFSFCCDVSR